MTTNSTKRPRWKTVVGWLLPAAALVAGVVVVVRPSTEPAEVVRAYLDAVRRGDVKTAMTYVEGSQQLDRDVPVLTDTAGGDWEILDIVQHDGDDYAEVRVRLGVDGREVPVEDGDPDWFTLKEKPDGGWRITWPLAQIIVEDNPFQYIDIGGAHQKISPEPERREYLVFPGVHQIHPRTAGLVKIHPERVALAPGSTSAVAAEVTLTEEGRTAAAEALRGYLNGCAAQPTPAPEGCPFRTGELIRLDLDTTLRDVADVTYQMTRYPEVEIDEHLGGRWFPTGGSQPTAQVRVAGTGVDEVGQRRPFTFDCVFTTIFLGVQLDADRRMVAVHDMPGGAITPCGDV